MEIPEEWTKLAANKWQGSILILGAPSSGKSTFGRYLYQQIVPQHDKVAYLDADVGQQELGLPASITVAVSGDANSGEFPPSGPRQMRFVGNNSPRGHFVPLLLGLHHLQRFAREAGARAVIIDTSGFIDTSRGAAILKWAKVELLEPSYVVALQRQKELEPILAPLRHLLDRRLLVLPVPTAAQERSPDERRAHRANYFQRHFQEAQIVGLSYRRLAVFPQRQFNPGQLVALEDFSGSALALGVVERVEPREQSVWLWTPWWGQGKIAALRLGSLRLNKETFRDEPV